MKTEIVNVPGKGICILISDINVDDFIHGVKNMKSINMFGGHFTNIHVIADQIRLGKKIGAIKEVKAQTKWGLREAKEYIDRFMPNGVSYNLSTIDKQFYFDRCANKFLQAHMPEDFLSDEEFKI